MAKTLSSSEFADSRHDSYTEGNYDDNGNATSDEP